MKKAFWHKNLGHPGPQALWCCPDAKEGTTPTCGETHSIYTDGNYQAPLSGKKIIELAGIELDILARLRRTVLSNNAPVMTLPVQIKCSRKPALTFRLQCKKCLWVAGLLFFLFFPVLSTVWLQGQTNPNPRQLPKFKGVRLVPLALYPSVLGSF